MSVPSLRIVDITPPYIVLHHHHQSWIRRNHRPCGAQRGEEVEFLKFSVSRLAFAQLDEGWLYVPEATIEY